MFNKKQTRKNHIKRSATARKHFKNVRRLGLSAKNMRGGSPASDLVMQDLTLKKPLNDFVTSPRIRTDGYNNSLDSLLSAQRPQMGGSPASDLVMANLTNTPTHNKNTIVNAPQQKGDMNSLNLYKTTGGMINMDMEQTTDGKPCNCKCSKCTNTSKIHHTKSKNNKQTACKCKHCHCNCMCKHCNSKKSSKTKQNIKKKMSMSMQSGGFSDWMSSQYSLGNINSADSGLSGNFTSQGITSRSALMNPANMGKAGSGYPMSSLEGANVGRTGAPF